MYCIMYIAYYGKSTCVVPWMTILAFFFHFKRYAFCIHILIIIIGEEQIEVLLISEMSFSIRLLGTGKDRTSTTHLRPLGGLWHSLNRMHEFSRFEGAIESKSYMEEFSMNRSVLIGLLPYWNHFHLIGHTIKNQHFIVQSEMYICPLELSPPHCFWHCSFHSLWWHLHY